MSEPVIEIWRPDALGIASCEQDIAGLARVLHACVHGGASVSFVLPFSIEDSAAFWREKVLPPTLAGERLVMIVRIDGVIAATVQLILATPPNQPHRVDIAKLLVHPDYRRRGLARKLMVAAENEAQQAGRTLITLDTLTGGDAEPLYLALGYQSLGVIPRYSRATHSMELEGATFFYKEILKAGG